MCGTDRAALRGRRAAAPATAGAGAVAPRHGARADARGQLLVGQRPPARADGAQLLLQPLAVDRAAHDPGARRLGEGGIELSWRQGREQHLALRGRGRREAGADVHAQRDDLGDGDARDVHDVATVELRHRRGLPGLADEVLQVRPGHVPQPQRGGVGRAQAQHPRGQAEALRGAAHVAELGEGQQQPARRGPGQPGRGRDLGEGHRAVLGVEAGEDVESPRQRLHEVRAGAASCHERPPVRSADGPSGPPCPSMFAQRTLLWGVGSPDDRRPDDCPAPMPRRGTA